jgi:hypothetical protein
MPSVKLPRKVRESSRSRTNIYFRATTKAEGSKVARERYDLSLSGLCNQLIDREIRTKGGLLHARLSSRT